MNITREVILDLLPVYLAGEASPATRALIEEYMEQDKELAQRIRVQWADNFAKITPAALPPDLSYGRSAAHARCSAGRSGSSLSRLLSPRSRSLVNSLSRMAASRSFIS